MDREQTMVFQDPQGHEVAALKHLTDQQEEDIRWLLQLCARLNLRIEKLERDRDRIEDLEKNLRILSGSVGISLGESKETCSDGISKTMESGVDTV